MVNRNDIIEFFKMKNFYIENAKITEGTDTVDIVLFKKGIVSTSNANHYSKITVTLSPTTIRYKVELINDENGRSLSLTMTPKDQVSVDLHVDYCYVENILLFLNTYIDSAVLFTYSTTL